MRARKLVYENVPDMCSAVRELSFEPHRFHECLAAIVASSCGTDGGKGLLEARVAEYASTSPLEWAKELDELYELLGPGSFLMKKVADSANHQMTIQPSLLPRCIMDEFPRAGTYQSRLIGGLRREPTGTFTIRLWEWFWINFIKSFLGMQLEDQRVSFQQQMAEDDFFGSISRNPYLGILHRNITQIQTTLKIRLVDLIHILLIEELQFKFKKRQTNAPQEQVKYRLKPHYLHLLYILILCAQPEEENVKNYYMYLEKIAQNYSSITVLSHNQNIRNMLRVWLTLITRNVTVQQQLFQKLNMANDKEGWFRLARCPIQRFQASLQHLKIAPRELGRAYAAKRAILHLLEKSGEWQPTYSMLAVLEQILIFEQKRGGMEFQRDREEQGGIIVRAVQRLLMAFIEEKNNKDLVIRTHQRISARVSQLYARGVTLNIDEKSLQRAKNRSKAMTDRGGLIVNQTVRKHNVWAYPLQQNEFLLLYRLTHWVAEQLDRVIPGENMSQHPRVNLRIFANPLVFLIIVSLIVGIIKVNLI